MPIGKGLFISIKEGQYFHFFYLILIVSCNKSCLSLVLFWGVSKGMEELLVHFKCFLFDILLFSFNKYFGTIIIKKNYYIYCEYLHCFFIIFLISSERHYFSNNIIILMTIPCILGEFMMIYINRIRYF